MVTKIGGKVQQFYNTTPFPDYELDRFKTKEDLITAANEFAKILDRSIPTDATIIDIGTGTGQLSAFLSLKRKCVYGIDFSDSSLKKAEALKQKLNLSSWNLKKVDILDTEQIDNIGMQFDYVLCMGVLHHTGNAYFGFQNILRLLKPGGYVAIGLYNKFGRIPLKLRKTMAKTIFKNNTRIKNKFLNMLTGGIDDKERARGIWNDQYLHPHETCHTVGEVLKWFKLNNISYYQTTPSMNVFEEENLSISGVWDKTENKPPNLLTRVYKQLTWIWKTNNEGGYWITFGRKN